MNKKIVLLLSMFMALTTLPVAAKNAAVQTLEDFSFKNPPQTLNIKILSNIQLNKDVMLYEGYTVSGKIENVNQNSFRFVPIQYKNFHNETFDVDDSSYATFVGMLDGKNKISNEGIIKKDLKFVLDFVEQDKTNTNELETKYQNVTPQEGGIAPQVSKESPILLDDKIPQTSKEFPGEKLNSFDNSSNFNLEEPVLQAQPKETNINNLKVK